MRKRCRFGAALMLASLFSVSAKAEFEAQHPVFAQAEQALAQNRLDEADQLIVALRGYPLYPWLAAKRAALSLDDGASAELVERYPWTRQSEILRGRWLEKLANAGDWASFERYYRDADRPALQCGHFLALAQSGRTAEAYAGAEKLWASGETSPALCERLFAAWRAGPDFDHGQIWKRLSQALLKNNEALATQLEALLTPDERERAAFMRQVHDHPQLILSCPYWTRPDPVSARIFAHGVERLAASDPLLAQTAWSLHQSRFPLDTDTVAQVGRKLATTLATDRYDQATAYLLAIPPQQADAQTRAWRVRAALRQQDWSGVLDALSLMSPEEQTQAQWRYWKARALEASGRSAEAVEHYRQAANEQDFHGYLAADRLNQAYPLVDRPGYADPALTQKLLASEPFGAIREWRALGRDGEARAEFAYITKSLSPPEQLAAARLAQQWGWDALAISAAAKSGSRDDLSLRFPLAFRPAIQQHANLHGLNPALLFGLIRRESAFDPAAGSSVGARGLMQLMPATGEQLARRFNEKLPGDQALFEPERNLRYGTAYLRGLLDRFGHFALAAAGYNAGPNRVDRWLPADAPMPADIWIETIPVSETRQYVSAIVAYAAAYQLRLGLPATRVSAWLPEVRPGPKSQAQPDRATAVPVCEAGSGTY